MHCLLPLVAVLSPFVVQGLSLRGGWVSEEAAVMEKPLMAMDSSELWAEFERFTSRFHKKYTNLVEFEERFLIFHDNVEAIVRHNRMPGQNFTLGINQFSDLTADEFKAWYVSGLRLGEEEEETFDSDDNGADEEHAGDSSRLTAYGCKPFASHGPNGGSLPDAVDWRVKGAVTSVKDQGQCGSCWTFSSTGAIEGAMALAKGQLKDFSEQELVDCATGVAYGSHGCNGGQMDGAFKYVIQNGQCLLDSYPYVSGTTKTAGSCKPCTAVAQLSGCADVQPNDQLALKAAVAQQPVAVAIEADTRYFQSYSGGVLTSAANCGTNLDHGVLVVGYGEENGQKYWLVKNSWGTTWGDNGYVKIGRSESSNDAGVCGIAMMASFPIV